VRFVVVEVVEVVALEVVVAVRMLFESACVFVYNDNVFG